MSLPRHVATADEPIPPYRGRPGDGPDMHHAMPIADMLIDLARFADDEVGYAKRWRELVASIGVSVTVSIERDNTRSLMIGSPCDAHTRHRSRWMHFLIEDLRKDEQRRRLLVRGLIEDRLYIDHRRPDPRATTRAIRDYVRTGGRILIDPNGHLKEGVGLPRAFNDGTNDDVVAIVRATKAYSKVRSRWRSERQIKRAVRMLGKPTGNGWLVLEAPLASQREL
jgi:hypothetical protein